MRRRARILGGIEGLFNSPGPWMANVFPWGPPRADDIDVDDGFDLPFRKKNFEREKGIGVELSTINFAIVY